MKKLVAAEMKRSEDPLLDALENGMDFLLELHTRIVDGAKEDEADIEDVFAEAATCSDENQ